MANTLSKIAPPGSTSSVSIEAVSSNKDGNCIGQLFMRSLNHEIRKMTFSTTSSN